MPGFQVVLLAGLLALSLAPHPPAATAAAPPTAPVPEPGPEMEPGASPGPDLRSRLQDAEPAEAAQILRAYAQEKGIPLDDRLPMPAQPDFGIWLPTGRFTPEPGVEEGLLARARALSDPGTEVALLLQLNRRPSLGEMIDLYELGLKGLAEDVPNYGHAVLAPAGSLPALSTRPYVRWLGEYRPEFKYRAHDPAARDNGRAFVYPLDRDRDEHRAALEAMGIAVEGYDEQRRFYHARLDEARMAEVAALLWVRWIEREPAEVLLLQAGGTFEPEDSRELVCAFDSLRTGEGVIVGVRDNGIYWNGTEHVDFAGRIAAGSDTSVNGDHGTHVTGIVLGGGTIDLAGTYDARGVAPGASVFFQNFASAYTGAFATWAANDVQLSNHSWGFTGSYDYDSDTRNIDEYADDEDMIVVVAAGNSGPAANTVTNPGTGKNVITVGAVRYVTDDAVADRVLGGVTQYSSRGPTLANGRLKPDLVAPGGQEWGDHADFRHGVVSCNENPNGTASGDEWPENDHYDRMSGTSMATPHVAGALALMLEAHPGLSAEAAKARLIGGTIPLKTSSGSDSRCAYANTTAGYGLLNAFHAAGYGCPSSAQTLIWVEGQVDYQDDSDEYAFDVPAGTVQLVAVVAYDDASYDNTGQLGDDIDLSLIDGMGTDNYYARPSDVTVEGTVEKMIVEGPLSGSWTARVDFGPKYLSSIQDYSLYILAILEQPALGLTTALPHASPYLPGEAFSLATTAQNTGGWIAAGVTAKIDWATAGLANTTRFVDSLVCDGASRSIAVDLQAPTDWGTYAFSLILDGLNRGLQPVSRQFSIEVCDYASSPSLLQPPNGAVTCDSTPTFDWNALTGAPSYRLQVDDDPAFGSPQINVLVANDYYTPGAALSPSLYYWRVRGESAACQGPWTAGRYLTVAVAPAAPALYWPEDASQTCDTTPYLIWDAVSGASSYQIQMDADPSFASPEVSDTTSNTAYTVEAALAPGVYAWRVRAANGCGWGAWSASRSLSIPDTINPPLLYAPAQGQETCDTTPTFDWADMAGVTSYHLQVDDDSNFGSPAIDVGISGSAYTPASSLVRTRYYWRVRNYGACGYGAWSETRSFDIVDVPTVPLHVTPANGSEQCNTSLSLQWSADWASSYRVQVSESPSFGSLVIDAVTESPHYEPSSALPPGTYYWRVWASNGCGGSGWSSPWSVTLRELPAAPVLTFPAAGAVECDTTPIFEWSLSTVGVGQYQIQVDDVSSFSSPDREATTSVPTYTPASPLAASKFWFWRVRGRTVCGDGPWSMASFYLATSAPAVPSLASPADGSALCDTTPALDWSSVSWASSYKIEVDDDAGFGSPAISQTVPSSEHTPGTALAPGTYYWRVQACNGCGCSAWTPAWDLIVRPTPEAAILSSPSDGSTTGDDTPTLSWHYVVDAVEYRLQVDGDPAFGSSEVDQTTANTSLTPASPLANGIYHWHVQASNGTCWGPWSNARQFEVDTNCPTVATPALLSPPVGETCDTTPTFQWSAAGGASYYQIQVDDEGGFPAPLLDTTTAATEYTMSTELAYRSYYWRVRGCNACGCGSWAVAWSLEVTGPPWYIGSILLSPADGAGTCDATPTFGWAAINGVTHYEIEVDDDPAFVSPELDATPTASSYTPLSNLPSAAYRWHVRPCNSCGCGQWSETRALNVLATPAAPALALPLDGSRTGDDSPTFAWDSPFGAASHDLQVDDDPGFGSPEVEATTAYTTYTAVAGLPDGDYHWQVRASNACGTGAWSSAWQFTLDSACLITTSPSLASPASGSSTCGATPAFAWSAVGGATSYQIQVDDSGPSLPSPLLDATAPGPAYTPAAALPPGSYHWWARACNECGCGPWSPAWSLTIDAAPGAVPLLLTPAAGSSTCDTTPDLAWQLVGGATSYHVQVDDLPIFASPEVDDMTAATSYTPLAPLAAGSHSWRVQACNGCGCGSWAAAWDLIVPGAAPALVLPTNDALSCDPMPDFDWSGVPGATSYRLQVDDDVGFGSPEVESVTSVSDYTPAAPLTAGSHYWRVQSLSACGDGAWAVARHLAVGAVPRPAALLSPADGSRTDDGRPRFEWSPAVGATAYELQVATDPGFGSPVIDVSTPDSHFLPEALLAPGSYYWRVQASNPCGSSAWPAPWLLIGGQERIYLPLVLR